MRHTIVSICVECSLMRRPGACLWVQVTLRVWGMILNESRVTGRRRPVAMCRSRHAMPTIAFAGVSDMTVSVLAMYRRRGDAPL